MQKQKRTEPNPIRYWWNELLFAREQIIETDLDLDELSDSLLAMEHGRQGFWWGLLRSAQVQPHPNRKGLDFKIQSSRKRWGDIFSIPTASASGHALADSATGRIRIQMKVTFGWFLHLLLLFYLFMIVGMFIPAIVSEAGAGMLFIPLIWFMFLSIYWGIIYRDRNRLAEDIQQQVTAPQKRKTDDFSRLSQLDREDDMLREVRYDSQQKRR